MIKNLVVLNLSINLNKVQENKNRKIKRIWFQFIIKMLMTTFLGLIYTILNK